MLFSLEAYPQERAPPLISLSVLEECVGKLSLYLSGADPINHCTLHHFRCVLAVHLPYSEPPRGALHLCYHTGFCSSGAMSNCQLVVIPACYFSVFHSFCVLSQVCLVCPLSVLSVCFFFFFCFFIEEALAVSWVWHVLMLRELPLSENVTISLIPHLHF